MRKLPFEAVLDLETSSAPTWRWQRELQVGDACVFSFCIDDKPYFAYLVLEEQPAHLPKGYVYGKILTDIGKDGVAAVHQSEILQTVSRAQIEAAARCGYRSAPEAVMTIINYSHTRGEA